MTMQVDVPNKQAHVARGFHVGGKNPSRDPYPPGDRQAR
jgi:hypothetical protein